MGEGGLRQLRLGGVIPLGSLTGVEWAEPRPAILPRAPPAGRPHQGDQGTSSPAITTTVKGVGDRCLLPDAQLGTAPRCIPGQCLSP